VLIKINSESDQKLSSYQNQSYVAKLIYTQREKIEGDDTQTISVPPKTEGSSVPLHFQGIFTIITQDYNLLKYTSKRLHLLNHTRKKLLRMSLF